MGGGDASQPSDHEGGLGFFEGHDGVGVGVDVGVCLLAWVVAVEQADARAADEGFFCALAGWHPAVSVACDGHGVFECCLHRWTPVFRWKGVTRKRPEIIPRPR